MKYFTTLNYLTSQVLRNLPAGSNASSGITLCIEDPLDSSNDVGRGSFLFYRVKSAFEDAYITLQRLLRPDKIMLGEAVEDKSRTLDKGIGPKRITRAKLADECNRYFY